MVNANVDDLTDFPRRAAARADLRETLRALPALDVFTRLEDAREAWETLGARAPSAYQRIEFAQAWLESFGAARGLRPMIVVARDADARPLALLPLAEQRLGPLRVATVLGGKESNFNLGLLDPNARLDAGAARALLRRAARARSVDLVWLRNQPIVFDGVANPFALPGSTPSPSFAYETLLPPTPEALDARFSGDTRKKLRKKLARLETMGAVGFEHAAEGARARRILETLLAQKAARLQDESFARDPMRAFVLGRCGGALEAHALTLDGRVVAAYAGLTQGGRFSALLNSFDADAEIARSSPGDLLLHALLRHLARRGVARFDLGVGEARYKTSVCDETIALVDTIVPTSLLGALAAPAFAAYSRAKRGVKQNPALLDALTRLRRTR